MEFITENKNIKLENLNNVENIVCEELNQGKKVQLEFDKRNGTIKLLRISTKKITTVEN